MGVGIDLSFVVMSFLSRMPWLFCKSNLTIVAFTSFPPYIPSSMSCVACICFNRLKVAENNGCILPHSSSVSSSTWSQSANPCIVGRLCCFLPFVARYLSSSSHMRSSYLVGLPTGRGSLERNLAFRLLFIRIMNVSNLDVVCSVGVLAICLAYVSLFDKRINSV